MTEEDEQIFQNTDEHHICEKKFSPKDKKARHHCTAHKHCNAMFKIQNSSPFSQSEGLRFTFYYATDWFDCKKEQISGQKRKGETDGN